MDKEEIKSNNTGTNDPSKTGKTPIPNSTINNTDSDIQSISPEAFGLLNKQRKIPEHRTPPVKIPPKDNNPVTEKTKKNIDDDSLVLFDHLSSIDIAIKEDEKRLTEDKLKEEEEESEEYSKGRILIFISTILIILGLIITVGIFIINKSDLVNKPEEEQIKSLISFETFTRFNIANSDSKSFQNKISEEISGTTSAENSINYNLLTTGINKNPIKAVDFVDLALLNMPDILKRVLTDDFMLGSYSSSGKNPFLILKFSSFRNAYTGMLSWEENIKDDFKEIFKINTDEQINYGTSTEMNKISKFEDIVVSNKYVRQLKNKNNEVILLYGIIDSETLIITVNEVTFKELLDRINRKTFINI